MNKLTLKEKIPAIAFGTSRVRLTFNDDEIAHLRASGNAPEVRCYAEAGTPQAVQALCCATLGRLA